MEVILSNVIDPNLLNNEEKSYCLNILEEILQSETRPYDAYFSSKPTPSSIVEEIAEVSANIVSLEKRIRQLLVEHKSEVLHKVLGDSSRTRLANIHDELDQLWELDEEKNDKTISKDELAFEEILDPEASIKKTQDDQFQMALHKLRQRVSKNDDNSTGSPGDLACILENLNSITDLMELPFLSRTCIRTGHYQEAVMLYTHTKSLQLKFPGSATVKQVCENVLNEITTTMLTGLAKLLSTNVSVNSIKKILNYLAAIPPFDNTESALLLRVFLHMRFNFIQREISSYSLKLDEANESLTEMMVKRKIEVLREYAYMSANVFMEMFSFPTEPLCINVAEELKIEGASFKEDTPVDTNALILQFINECIEWLLKDLLNAGLKGKLTDSVCLQLVYCSFRLDDLNQNYHKLFLNKIHESDLFSAEQLRNAIQKRRDLTSRYS